MEPTVSPAPTREPAGAEKLTAAEPALKLNAETLHLGVKERFTLVATRLPEGVTAVTYQSSDPAVVAVDATGNLNALRLGSADVTAVAGDASAVCSVTVFSTPGKLSLSKQKAVLGVGQAMALSAVLPAGTASQITWKSSKSAVATVDDSGVVTARGTGKAKINGYTYNGKKAVCEVTVKPAPTSFSAKLDTATLSVGMTRTVTVAWTKGAMCSVTVTSDNPEVISASGTTLKAVGIGAATITAATHNGLTQTLRLTVVAAPTHVTIPAESLTLGKGEKFTLAPVFDNGAPADITWVSTNPGVVKVSAGGGLTAKKRGSAAVTLTTHNGLTATCAVKVVKAPSKVTLPKQASMGAGETRQLTAKLSKGSGSTLTWVSANPAVATVDASGRVTAIAPGTAKITVRTFNKKKATCKITVKAAPTSVSFQNGIRTLGVGMKVDMKPAVNAGSAGSIVLSSDNPGAVSVSGTAVTAIAPGSARITATTYNGRTAAVDLTVLPAPTSLSLGAATLYLGVKESITLNPKVNSGAAASFTFKSSRKKYASVSATGVVKAKKKGTTTITVTTYNGLKARVKVKVVKAPSKLTLSPASATLEQGELFQLSAKLPKGTASIISYSSSNPAVVTVDAAGMLCAVQPGTATVTATTYNNKKAVCKVTVTGIRQAPAQPSDLRLTALGGTGLTISWSASNGATGYRVYLSRNGAGPERYGDFGASTTSAAIRGLSEGISYTVYVTAFNSHGESALGAGVNGTVTGVNSGDSVSLSDGMVLMKVGAAWSLTAAVSPSGDASGLSWETSSAAIARIAASGAACTVTAVATGTATVSAVLPNGASASTTVMVVNTGDLSASNYASVQKALLNHEELIDTAAGGNVIWDMVSQSLLKANYALERVNLMIDKLKSADSLYRNLYLYSFGTYDQVAEARQDKQGDLVTVSNYDPADNTLYLLPNPSMADETYAYLALHETGHAIDYNADGNNALNSLNGDATAALLSDVRAALEDRVAAAVTASGAAAASVSGDKVVDALLNYRELLHHDEVMATLNAEEQKVYNQLSADMANEMNNTLPVNNGCMVWDAVEGATNYAVSGSFGHAYLLSMSAYQEAATYYYYDRKGSPTLTTEPWAEFFSSNIMQDAATLSVNLAYLPRTCKYFAETFAPKVLDYFKSLVRSK